MNHQTKRQSATGCHSNKLVRPGGCYQSFAAGFYYKRRHESSGTCGSNLYNNHKCHVSNKVTYCLYAASGLIIRNSWLIPTQETGASSPCCAHQTGLVVLLQLVHNSPSDWYSQEKWQMWQRLLLMNRPRCIPASQGVYIAKPVFPRSPSSSRP